MKKRRNKLSVQEMEVISKVAYDVPAYDVPAYDVPAYDVPAYDVPAYDVPAYDVPAWDVEVLPGPIKVETVKSTRVKTKLNFNK